MRIQIVDIGSSKRQLSKCAEQFLLLFGRAAIQELRKLVSELRFDPQPPTNRPLTIRLLREQRDPVVVQVANVFVGEIVYRVMQILAHPGMLWFAKSG